MGMRDSSEWRRGPRRTCLGDDVAGRIHRLLRGKLSSRRPLLIKRLTSERGADGGEQCLITGIGPMHLLAAESIMDDGGCTKETHRVDQLVLHRQNPAD